VIRVWSWNLHGAFQLYQSVIDVVSKADVDLILAQEVRQSVARAGWTVVPEPGPAWGIPQHGCYQSAVLHKPGTFRVEPHPEAVPLADARWDQLGLSIPGSASAATIYPGAAEPIILVSVYCPWDGPGLKWQRGSGLVISDANAHRVVSDIAMLNDVIDNPDAHRVIVAGDWNILRGYGEEASPYWARRYASVFERMEALGFAFSGPMAPDGGRQAHPWPVELPTDSRCVPTFHPSSRTPAGAARQLDFVFASKSLEAAVQTRARNQPDEWGPSDHCVIEIDIDPALC
jgi:exonuclease III